MKHALLLFFAIWTALPVHTQAPVRFDLESWTLSIDKKGLLTKLEPGGKGRNLLVKGQASPRASCGQHARHAR